MKRLLLAVLLLSSQAHAFTRYFSVVPPHRGIHPVTKVMGYISPFTSLEKQMKQSIYVDESALIQYIILTGPDTLNTSLDSQVSIIPGCTEMTRDQMVKACAKLTANHEFSMPWGTGVKKIQTVKVP